MSEFIYGLNVCKAALESEHPIKEVLIDKENSTLINYMRSIKVPFRLVNKEFLNRFGNNHQGIAIEISSYKNYQLTDIIRHENESNFNQALIIIVDGLQDPHNFGAILRIADAAGVDGIIYRKDRNVKINSTVVRISTGAYFYTKCVEVTNISNTMKRLKQYGYWLVGAEVDMRSQSYQSIDYKMATGLIIGSEGAGLSRLVRDNCDFLVEIPMYGSVNSLNAAVACGILTYHIKNHQN